MSKPVHRLRTDSSKELRARLQKDYVGTREVLNSLSFDKYIAYCWKLHADAEQCYARRDYANAYILYHTFGKFVTESLPKHNAYGFKQYSRDVNQLKLAFKAVLNQLDAVNAALDEEEDERLIQEELEGEEIDSCDNMPEYLKVSTPKPVYRPSITQLTSTIPLPEAAGMRSSRTSEVSRTSNTGRDSLPEAPARSRSQASNKSGSASPARGQRRSGTGSSSDVERLNKAFALLRPETGVPTEREPEHANPYSDLYSISAAPPNPDR